MNRFEYDDEEEDLNLPETPEEVIKWFEHLLADATAHPENYPSLGGKDPTKMKVNREMIRQQIDICKEIIEAAERGEAKLRKARARAAREHGTVDHTRRALSHLTVKPPKPGFDD